MVDSKGPEGGLANQGLGVSVAHSLEARGFARHAAACRSPVARTHVSHQLTFVASPLTKVTHQLTSATPRPDPTVCALGVVVALALAQCSVLSLLATTVE
jgi:hypothetical protein